MKKLHFLFIVLIAFNTDSFCFFGPRDIIKWCGECLTGNSYTNSDGILKILSEIMSSDAGKVLAPVVTFGLFCADKTGLVDDIFKKIHIKKTDKIEMSKTCTAKRINNHTETQAFISNINQNHQDAFTREQKHIFEWLVQMDIDAQTAHKLIISR